MNKSRFLVSLVLLGACLGILLLGSQLRDASVRPAEAVSSDVTSTESAPGGFLGPDRCGECHQPELEALQASAHHKGFKAMHRSDEAKAIAAKLGIRRIKSEARCIQCHYTPVEKRGKIRAGHGVSCESCHGPAASWIAIHDDFGGANLDASSETPAHRKQRKDQCRSLGMNWPELIIDIAGECYQCHVIADEELIDKAGHPTGDFELVAWTQGEVRHNFGDSPENKEAPLERRRVLFVTGQMLDLEFNLRALATASKDGAMATAARARATAALKRLADLAKVLDDPSLDSILEGTRGVQLTPGAVTPGDAPKNRSHASGARAALLDTAKKVHDAAVQFTASHDGSKLGMVDSHLPASGSYRGTPKNGS